MKGSKGDGIGMSRRLLFLCCAIVCGLGAILSCSILQAGTYLNSSNAVLNGGVIVGPDSDIYHTNCMLVPTGVENYVEWTIHLVPGQKYKITAMRHVYCCFATHFDMLGPGGTYRDGRCQLGYQLSVDSKLYTVDWATESSLAVDERFTPRTFQGYYTPTSATTTVKVHNAGLFGARIEWIRFEPTDDVYFDINTPGLQFQGVYSNAGNTLPYFSNINPYPANYGCMPVSGPNSFIIGFDEYLGPDSGVYGDVTLVPGATYRVYSCRNMRPEVWTLSYDVELNGELFAHDSAQTLVSLSDYSDEKYLGDYTPTYAVNTVRIYNPGAYGSRVAYIRFERVSEGSRIFDESNVSSFTGNAYAFHLNGATPESGDNVVTAGWAANPGTVNWSMNLTPGRKYVITPRRYMRNDTNCNFGIYFNGVQYMTDLAFDPLTVHSDTLQEWTPMGYLKPTNAVNTLSIQNPGPYGCTIDRISVTPTDDVYFDVNADNLVFSPSTTAITTTFSPNFGWPWNPMSMPILGPNGFAFWNGEDGPATISGTVNLVPGAGYKVYAMRKVHAHGNTYYDLALNGNFFAHDSQTPAVYQTDGNGNMTSAWAHDEFIEEAYIGYHFATSAVTQVEYSNPGVWGGTPGYLRFVLDSLPTTVQTLAEAKELAIGTSVSFAQPLIATVGSATFSDGSYYVEDSNRVTGIKVVPVNTGSSVSVSDNVVLAGYISLDDNGEKCIKAHTATGSSGGTMIEPLGLTNKTAANMVGPQTIGLLIKVWGIVKSVDSYYAVIDDGSGFPVKIMLSHLAVPLTETINTGDYLMVTGVAGLTWGGEVAVYPRGDDDLDFVVPAPQ